ncbi:ABC transporter permease subunit [Pseudorhodoplanes sinuspersici]|uniref:Metal-dependent hydrolase n=1 Tax=Pseudorhodoplanes sinuspersici TaxID=1235591 RepID=A0A1W6ZL75_9HYPH|nr:branched-chain amino acid ABC transporter ATP-binding protein/permease [Pseudorhodoplanes sinuspersici]ARP98015.1 metal-dependent hydrolase [Pseudorhodoplanes sinuspersici]RKE68231.1 amino acid/amide ABC transporter membrane protein 2 (HAAT family) /amino acid/amide ABC transporter ATP-binding protein 1 (HAAT family) [Pseudorhodoplanes sinuspersici]
MRRVIVIAIIFLFALLPVLPFVPRFWITLLNTIGISTIVVMGVVVLTGCASITSFAQAAFVGVGAYTAALLSANLVSPWVALIPAIALTGFSAYLIGVVTLRLSGHYLALATIAWSITLFYAFGVSDLLGRFDGITSIKPVSFFGMPLRDPSEFYYVILVAVLLSMLATHNFLYSRVGRSVRALRGGRTVAEANGINSTAARQVAFVYSACLAGLSGWLFAHLQRAINPTPFGLSVSIEYVLKAVVGGVSNIGGALLGSAIVTLTQDQLQNVLPHVFGSNQNFEAVVFGIALVALLQWAPEGVWPSFSKIIRTTKKSSKKRKFKMEEGPKLPIAPLPERNTILLNVEGLSKSFGGLHAVRDMSLQLSAGEVVGLIGPNGAGKSTTFNLLTGVIQADSGRVVYRGQDISRWISRDVAQLGVARTFQHVKLVPEMSVIENVVLGTHLRTRSGAIRGTLALNSSEDGAAFAEAYNKLERVGLSALAYEPATTLALGQQRIVEVARALCLSPALLMLDEPAAGLRKSEKEKLAELLQSLRAEGITILMVEHDMEFVMGLVDRLIVMNFGSKLAEGRPDAIRADPEVIRAYLGGVT